MFNLADPRRDRRLRPRADPASLVAANGNDPDCRAVDRCPQSRARRVRVTAAGVGPGASGHAVQLARLGRLQHASRAARPGQGENLWIGSRGAFALDTMVGDWAAERRLFRPGRFPATSRTGNWADTGHFTAMVWPTTRRLGCGIGSSARWDVLVCRYWPAGNVDGVSLGQT